MKVGDYVRTKKRGFQYPQIARIKDVGKDSNYHNQYYIELNHNLIPDYEFHIYEEDIKKSSPNIIDLIEVGDYVNGHRVLDIAKIPKRALYLNDISQHGALIPRRNIKSIVTKEQFESMEYKIGSE